MKRKLVVLFLLLGIAAYAQYQNRAAQHFITLNGNAAVPVSITTNVVIWANTITFKGLKAGQVNNTGNVFIGLSSVDGTQHMLIIPGGEVVYRCPENERVNLGAFYLDVVTVADGVSVTYQ